MTCAEGGSVDDLSSALPPQDRPSRSRPRNARVGPSNETLATGSGPGVLGMIFSGPRIGVLGVAARAPVGRFQRPRLESGGLRDVTPSAPTGVAPKTPFAGGASRATGDPPGPRPRVAAKENIGLEYPEI